MFVIGRNVRVKVENGELIIKCVLANTVGRDDVSARKRIIATTIHPTHVPHTDLYVEFTVYERRKG